MATVEGPLDEQAAKVTGEALQGALVDVLDLSLIAKQAHWNLLGRHFRSLHLQLDEIVASARGYADQLAERAVALGLNPDGRAATVARTTSVTQLDGGWVKDTDVIAHFVGVYAGMVARMRGRVDATGQSDPVTQDLLLALTADLEKQSWMLQAQQ